VNENDVEDVVTRKLEEAIERLGAVPRFIGMDAAAHRTGVSVASIRRLIQTGRLKGYRPAAGRIVVDVRELDTVVLTSSKRPRAGRGGYRRGRRARGQEENPV
jgi:hypothetical protein